jgi:hypothetical protein
MSCRGKAMHALGECDCYFKPADFVDLLEREREWFELLMDLSRQRWQRSWPEESTKGFALL